MHTTLGCTAFDPLRMAPIKLFWRLLFHKTLHDPYFTINMTLEFIILGVNYKMHYSDTMQIQYFWFRIW